MHAAGNGRRSGEERRSPSKKSVLRGVPDKRGNWSSVGRPDLPTRDGEQVTRAARCREQRRKRQAIPAGLTGSDGRTRRSQVRVPMHHRPGLSEDQCQREQHAEPRGIPVLGREPGLCHTESIAWMTGRGRIHRGRSRERGIGSAVARTTDTIRGPISVRILRRSPRPSHGEDFRRLLPALRAAQPRGQDLEGR
jgi:hypothetical protein